VIVEGSESEIDPVCGMTVDIEAALADRRTLEHQGQRYGFCSSGCLVDFRDSPESYAEAPGGLLDRDPG
jgi:YHS domain-containing protein